MLTSDSAALVVIDIQGKLARMADRSEQMIARAGQMIRVARVLDIPVICAEQNPSKLGPTVEEIAPLLTETPIAKMAFSCCGQAEFNQAVAETGRKQILIVGIETHVCVYQTAIGLLAAGYGVQVVADAVSSRRAADKEVGLARLRQAGAQITCLEMALFEMLGSCEHEKFRDILRIVK